MAEFQELIKNFDRIRDYMRQFYVYGFKVRNDFSEKSARTYDNERRRIESWLSRYTKSDYTPRESMSTSMWTARPFPRIPCTLPGSPKALQTTT